MARQVMKFAGTVTQHWSRRWGVLLSLVLAATAGTIYVQNVLAVHDTGRFELDGNNESAPLDDWDRVCHQVTGNADCGTTSNTTGANPVGVTPATGAVAVTWTGDCLIGSSGFGCQNTNATIFTGGGSKDPQAINQWAWKDGAGGLPDKDNLVHAFAARYSSDRDDIHCPTLLPDGVTYAPTCEVVYFGSDRFDNSGDAQQGFWFLQNPISLGQNAVGGGQGFIGSHRNGDLLVISDFSNGGTTSTITVLKWDTTCTATDNSKNPPAQPCADANLRRLATSANALCGGATGDPYCGIVNTSALATQWPNDFQDKTGFHNYLAGEFFEAGVNLTTLGLGNECFSSVVSETRSSTSTTATLKDFVLGNFAQCGATLNTVPSVGAGGSVTPGSNVTDIATVTGTGTAAPPTPSGNVSFFMCGPTDPASTDLCQSGGTAAGVIALSGTGQPQGKATATSSIVAPTTPGRYCFRAEWPGDTNYTGGPFVHFGSGNSECFTVITIPTSTVTTPTDSSGTGIPNPLTTGVALGTALYDKAVVQGTAAGGNPPGSVSFAVCNPNQVTGAAGSEVCAAGAGSALSGNPRPLSPGANFTSSAVSSPGVTANLAGVWCFRASYLPTGGTYEASADVGSHSECVKVNPDATTTVTTPQAPAGTSISAPVAVGTSVFDKATVTGTLAGGTPTGTVSFFICNPSQVTGAAGSEVCATGGTAVTGNPKTLVADAGSSPPSASVTSGAVTANVVGVWCFRGEYTSDTVNYTGSSDARHSECFAVKDSTDITSAQDWLPNDSATVAATGGTALNGTLAFTLYPNAGCTGTPLYTQAPQTLTNASSLADRTKVTNNTTVKVLASTTVYWQVVFTSANEALVSSRTRCNEQTSLTIVNAAP